MDVESRDGDAPAVDAPAGLQEDQLTVLKSATIMMVDDDSISVEVTETFLADAGYSKFVGITDPREAFSALEEFEPDVLLLDLSMPEIDGTEILARVRADRSLRHLPTLVMTAATDAQTKLHCLELGATDFLAKPVDPSELVLRLRNILAAKAYQDRLAFYDALTGLPNRKLFLQRLASIVASPASPEGISAVLHLDIDRFQQINEALGLVAADGLLKEVGGRLVECVRSADLVGRADGPNERADVSRLGGDEFSIMLTRTTDAASAEKVAKRLLEAFEEPFAVGGDELDLTASIGIAIYPEDALQPEGLMRCASAALAHAKDRGGNTHQFYSSELNADLARRIALTNDLRKGLGRGELVLWYQPKVDIATGAVDSAEALIRWQHPEIGLLMPDEFIPLAEAGGLIRDLGDWVIREAALQHERWREAGLGSIRISVNISGDHFGDPGLPSTVAQALATANSGADALCVELTETVVMEDPAAGVRALQSLRDMGVKLSVDDFGTGYSSLGYLKSLPIDELKIDKSFVEDLAENPDDRAIAAAIIGLAHTLGLSVVAEGVETQEHLAILTEQQCDQYQGYLFSRPIPAERFAELLAAHGSRGEAER